VTQHIIKRISHGYNSAAYPIENLMELDGRDKEWVARVVKRAGALYRDNLELPDKEEQVVTHYDRPTNQPGKQDIEVAKALYPVEIMRKSFTITAPFPRFIQFDLYAANSANFMKYVSQLGLTSSFDPKLKLSNSS
jgi:hypothetical protein